MSGPDSRVALVEPISLARGVPAPECLALEELADCARVAIERDGATALNYGPAGGYAPLREWIADRHRVEPERVVLTKGSLQGYPDQPHALPAALAISRNVTSLSSPGPDHELPQPR